MTLTLTSVTARKAQHRYGEYRLQAEFSCGLTLALSLTEHPRCAVVSSCCGATLVTLPFEPIAYLACGECSREVMYSFEEVETASEEFSCEALEALLARHLDPLTSIVAAQGAFSALMEWRDFLRSHISTSFDTWGHPSYTVKRKLRRELKRFKPVVLL